MTRANPTPKKAPPPLRLEWLAQTMARRALEAERWEKEAPSAS